MQESPPFLFLGLHTCVALRSLLPVIYPNQEPISCILAIPLQFPPPPHLTSRTARLLPQASFSQERAALQYFHLCFVFLLPPHGLCTSSKKEIFLWDPTFSQPRQPCLPLHLFSSAVLRHGLSPIFLPQNVCLPPSPSPPQFRRAQEPPPSPASWPFSG